MPAQMPLRITLLLALCLFSLIACHQKNQVASDKYKFIEAHGKHVKGKARRLLLNQIEKIQQSENQLTLQTKVTPSVDMQNATIRWQLPKGTQVLSGELEQEVDLQAGESQLFTITVDSSKLKKGDKFFFFSFQMKDGERHGSPSMYVYGQDGQNSPLQKSSLKKFKKIYQ